jgi:hypothetical protein
MKTRFSAIVVFCLAPCVAAAQVQINTAPTPGPEVGKLGYYVGTWKGHGTSEGGPSAPPGKLSSEMNCDWFAGGFQVVCRGDETSASGTRKFLDILSYDEQAKSYREYTINNEGDSEYDQGGVLAGNTLTYRVDMGSGAKRATFRYTEVRVSPVLRTYRAEASVGGAPWRVVAEGELDKVK